MNEITRILSDIEHGDPHAAEQLLPLVYDELRKLAAQKMAHEKPGQTLEATALVHEAYLQLVDKNQAADPYWNSRGHFFAAAAEAMRRILIGNARRKKADKRGGQWRRIELGAAEFPEHAEPEKFIALDAALDRLAANDPLKAEVVKLRFFAGLTNQETAQALNISTATAERYWAYARAWLQNEMQSSPPSF